MTYGHSKLHPALAVILLALLAGCSEPEPEHPPGQLFIIGGDLTADNAEIHGRLAAVMGQDDSWQVLPTASDATADIGPATVDLLRARGQQATLLDIHAETAERAWEDAAATAIGNARGLFFAGDNPDRLVTTFRPEEGDSPAFRAMRQMLAQGGIIAGSGAGAAAMSNPMIQGGTAALALQRGRAYGAGPLAEDGVSIGRGLGFFPYGMIDQHVLSRGRLGRLLVALEETPFVRGFGIDANRAIHVDLGSGRIEVIGGAMGLLLLDSSEEQRTRGSRLGLRVALLGSGDSVDGLSGRVTPARGKLPSGRPRGNLQDIPETSDAWARYALRDLMLLLADHPAQQAVALDPAYELRFSEDDRTQYWLHPDGGIDTLTIIGLRLDIVPREQG